MYSKKGYKGHKNIVALFTALIMILSSLLISTTAVFAEGGSTNPLQTVIVESMGFSDKTKRDNFVSEVLTPLLTVENVTTIIKNKVKTDYFTSMPENDINTALTTYASLKSSNKTILKMSISAGYGDITVPDTFSGIKQLINSEVTGSTTNNNGVKFLTKLLSTVREGAEVPIAGDGQADSDLIKLELTGNTGIKNVVSSLIDSMETLKTEIASSGSGSNFDKLLAYCQSNINEKPESEISQFKLFLKQNGSIYSGKVEEAARITNVTSDNADAAYTSGQTLEIKVIFDKAVEVSGTPKLKLNSGNDVRASYKSGSGTQTLIFEYVVGDGQRSSDLGYYGSTSLELNGGSITKGGIDAVLTLPTPATNGSLDKNKNIVVGDELPAPTVDVLAGTYNTAKTVTISQSADAVHTYYTTNGNAPNDETGTLYSLPVPIDGAEDETVTLKAISYDASGNESPVLTVLYKFDKVSPQDFESFDVHFDASNKNNSYIEFKTQEGIDYSGVDRLELRIGGEYATENIVLEELNGILSSSNLVLTNEGTQQNVAMGEVRSFIKNVGADLISIEADLQGGLQADSTYRFKINSELYNAIFSSAIDNIKIPDQAYSNFGFSLRNTLLSGVPGVESTIARENMEWDIGTQAQVKQLDGSKKVTFVGNEAVKHNFVFNGEFPNVKDYCYYMYGNFTADEMQSTYPSGNVSIAGTEGSLTTAYGNEPNLKITASLPETTNATNLEKLVEIKGSAGSKLKSILSDKIKDNNYRIYAVAKNSSGAIVGWNRLDDSDIELVTNPHFVSNDSGAKYEGYQAGINYTLADTGVTEDDRVIVEGTTTYTIGETTTELPFVVAFDRMPDSAGNYRFQGNFVNVNEENRYTKTVGDIKETSQLNGIPVSPVAVNNIKFKYTYENAEQQTVEVLKDGIEWSRGQVGASEVWSWANVDGRLDRIGPNSTVDIKINNFAGVKENLTVNAKFTNPYSAIPDIITVLELKKAELISQKSTEQGDEKVYRFSYVDKDINVLAEEGWNNQNNIRVYLNYNDDENDINRTEEIRMVSVDNQGPKPELMYDGEGSGEYEGLQGVVVRFHEDMNLENLIANKDQYFMLQDRNQKEIGSPEEVVGYRDEGDKRSNTEPYSAVKLYFTKVKSGYTIKMNGIKDMAGNEIEKDMVSEIKMDRKVTGTVKFADGTNASNAKVRMVEAESVLNSNDAKGTKNVINDQMLDTDANGKIFDYWMPSGDYSAYKVEINVPKIDGPGDMVVYCIDQDVKIEYSNGQDAQEINIVIPDANVTGKVELDPESTEKSPELMIMKTQYTQGDWAKVEDKFMIYDKFGKTTLADKDGNFDVYLAPGEYKVIGKRSGYSYIAPLKPVIFTVPSSGEYEITQKIEFPKMNVTGVIKDKKDEALNNAVVEIFEAGSGGEAVATVFTGSNGSFATALNEGSYFIKGIVKEKSNGRNGGVYMMDVEFDVNSSGEVENVTGDNQKEGSLNNVVVPDVNVSVVITSGTTPVNTGSYIELSVGSKNGKGPWLWSDSGQFDCYLEKGTYTIARAGSDKMFVDDLNQEFTVSESSNYTGSGAIKVDLAGSSNVTVTIKNESGQAIENAGINIEGKNNGIREFRNTDASGVAYFNLEPGKYRIPGYHDPTKGEHGAWQQYEKEFTVEEGKKTEIEIKVTTPNVVGTVKDTSGNLIKNGWLNIKRVPGENELFAEYYGTNTGENGAFAVNLKEGQYIIEGIGTMEKWHELNFKFFVVETEDDTLVMKLSKTGEAVTTLDVKKPADNIKGNVYKNSSHELYKGRTAEKEGDKNQQSDIWLVLRQAGVAEETYNLAPWMYEKWVTVSAEDGSFGVTVDSEKKYTPRAIVNAGRWIELDISTVSPKEAIEEGAIVPDSSKTLTIIPTAANFSGTVKDFDGKTLGRGWINLEKQDEKGNASQWIGMDIDEKGTFEKTLENGATYVIREASIMDSTSQTDPWKNATRYTFNKKIKIGESTSEMVLKPNTKGIIDLGSKEITAGKDTQQNTLGVQIRKVLSKSDANYEDSQKNPWKYETWTNLTYDKESKKYVFCTYLDVGDYKLSGIPSPSGWIDLSEDFSVKDASKSETYEFNCNQNVKGEILDNNGKPVANAWVDIEKVESTQQVNNGTWDPSKWIGTSTDGKGEFGVKMKDSPTDGYYRLNGYNTQGKWVGKTWQPGQRVQVNYKFKIINGKLCDMDGKELTKISIAPNVVGVVKKIYNLSKGDSASDFVGTAVNGKYAQVKDAWLTIKPYKQGKDDVDYTDWTDTIWVNTANTGEFNLMLPVGKYKVIDAGMKNDWMKLDITFEIKQNKEGKAVLVDLYNDSLENKNDYVIGGKLVVKSQLPNLRGVAYKDAARTQKVKWGWISVKPATAKDYDWSNVQWLNTKNDGSFEGRLAEGSWKITEISGPGYWLRVNILINVNAEGDITCPLDATQSDATKLVKQSNGSINVSPREPNVTGILKDAAGNAVNQNSWVTIKPANADRNDWSNTINCEYKDYNGQYRFETTLDKGEYKVVSFGSWNFWYESDIRFDVDADGNIAQVDSGTVSTISVGGTPKSVLTVAPPQPNAVGTVYAGQTVSADPVKQGWIAFAKYDENGKQITFDNQTITEENSGWKNQGDDIYWAHTRWTGTDANGEFKFHLEDGYYKVVSVNGMGTWYQSDTSFRIVDGELKDNSGDAISGINVLEPGPNMTITIKNSGAIDAGAWLEIKDTANGAVSVIQSTEKDEDGNYVFEKRFKDGKNTIVGFGTASMWSEIITDEFTIPDDSTVIYDFSKDEKERIVGNLYETAGTIETDAYWVGIKEVKDGALTGEEKWVQSKTDGTFTFKLGVDEKWAVIAVSNKNGFEKYASPEIANTHTVTDTVENTQTGWNIIISQIN